MQHGIRLDGVGKDHVVHGQSLSRHTPSISCKIGAIGHSDLRSQDIPAIQAALEMWLSQRHGRESAQRLEFLTGLVPGADRLTAWTVRHKTAEPVTMRLVLSNEDSGAPRAINAPEPLGENYPPECSLEELRQGFAENDMILLDELKSSTTSGTPHVSFIARYLAEHVDILLAVWDGVWGSASDSVGAAVHYALSSDCQKHRAHAGLRPIVIQWLAVPCKGNTHPASEAFTWQRLPTPFSPPTHGPFAWRYHIRKLQVILPAALALASVAVSLLGHWLEPPSTSGHKSTADFALTAISYLTLNAFEADVTVAGAPFIRAGQWLAVAFALATLASLMQGLFRWFDDIALAWTRSRRHDLVCGLGWRGRAFIADTAEARIPTIAVEASVNDTLREMCLRIGVPLVEGNASDPEIPIKLGIRHVRCAFVSCGTDEANMQAVHRLAIAARNHEFVCCVDLRAQHRFQVLQNALPEGHRMDLRIFNTEAVTARMLLQLQPIDRFTASPEATGAEVVVLGDSLMARALVDQVLQQGAFEIGKSLHVRWITPHAAKACQSFTAKHPIYRQKRADPEARICAAEPERPWLEYGVLPGITFLELPASDRELVDLLCLGRVFHPEKMVRSVIIATSDPAASASLSYAIAPCLERLREEMDVTLACYYNVWDDIYRADIERALNKDFPSLPIRAFSDFMGNCSKDVVLGDAIDRAARRVNGAYQVPSEAWDSPEFDDACKDLWRSLSETDKESNRQAAGHAWVKRRIRTRLRGLGVETTKIEGDLAEIEHRRWCAQHLLAGFRPLTRIPFGSEGLTLDEGEGRLLDEWLKDAGAKKKLKREKRHADLLPFYAFERIFTPSIAEKEKAKDLAQIHALDIILGRQT